MNALTSLLNQVDHGFIKMEADYDQAVAEFEAIVEAVLTPESRITLEKAKNYGWQVTCVVGQNIEMRPKKKSPKTNSVMIVQPDGLTYRK